MLQVFLPTPILKAVACSQNPFLLSALCRQNRTSKLTSNSHGRVTQRESATFTRWKSLVQTQSRLNKRQGFCLVSVFIWPIEVWSEPARSRTTGRRRANPIAPKQASHLLGWLVLFYAPILAQKGIKKVLRTCHSFQDWGGEKNLQHGLQNQFHNISFLVKWQ